MEAAATVLLAVLTDARKTKHDYRFGPLSAQTILASGLLVEGEIDDVHTLISRYPGLEVHDA